MRLWHGGDDLTMPAHDALTAYRALQAAGNSRRFSKLDHYLPSAERLVRAVGLAGFAN